MPVIRGQKTEKGINRIRLEFKAEYVMFMYRPVYRINRIRLEFKVDNLTTKMTGTAGINRIRLEFKAKKTKIY